MTTEPLTYRLNNGWIVLARIYEGDVYPFTFANRKQAEKRQAELGSGWKVAGPPLTRPFFVVKETD